MNYWDTSVLIKLYIREPDSEYFLGLVSASTEALASSDIARIEMYTALSRKEMAGELSVGEADRSFARFRSDIRAGRIVTIPVGSDVLLEATELTSRAHSNSSPILIRSLDAIHVASALVSGSQRVIATDNRLRDVAKLMNLSLLP